MVEHVRAQTSDSIAHHPAPAIEITATPETDLPTIDASNVEIKSARALQLATGSANVSEALRAMSSSLDIRRYGPLGGIALPRFRGLPQEYTIVFRDGIRLTNEQNSLTDLDQLSLHGVRTIELIPSASAVLLGGDAVGAVLNLVSDFHDDRTVRVGSEQLIYDGAQGISEHSYYGSASLRPTSSLSILANASDSRTNGSYPYLSNIDSTIVTRENSAAVLQSADVNALWEATEQTTLRAEANYFHANRGLPGPDITKDRGAYSLTDNQGDEDLLLAVHLDHKLDEWKFESDAAYQRQDERYTSPTYGIKDTSTNTLLQFDARLHHPIASWLEGYLGIQEIHSRLGGTTNASRSHDSIFYRDRTSAYVALNAKPTEAMHAALSLRAERVSDISQIQLLPQLSAGYQMTNDLAISAGYSKSYHAPTLNELYWLSLGNPNLKPEYGENWQASIHFDPSIESLQAHFAATYFHASITDEILWLDGPSGLNRPVNVDHVVSKGIELTASGSWSPYSHGLIRLEESYTILSARSSSADTTRTNKELPYTPPTSSLFMASFADGRVGTLSVMLNYHGHRFSDLFNSVLREMPPVTTTDISFTTRDIPFDELGLRLQLTVLNATNTYYAEEYNYPLPGRALKFSIELNYH